MTMIFNLVPHSKSNAKTLTNDEEESNETDEDLVDGGWSTTTAFTTKTRNQVLASTPDSNLFDYRGCLVASDTLTNSNYLWPRHSTDVNRSSRTLSQSAECHSPRRSSTDLCRYQNSIRHLRRKFDQDQTNAHRSSSHNSHPDHNLYLYCYSLLCLFAITVASVGHTVTAQVTSNQPNVTGPSHRFIVFHSNITHPGHIVAELPKWQSPKTATHQPLQPTTTSAKSLSVEELLQEATLEDAIRKLKDAWQQTHNEPNPLISPSSQTVKQSNFKQAQLGLPPVETRPKDSMQEGPKLNRSRRWTPDSVRFAKHSKKSKKMFDDEDLMMMAADDSRVYQTTAKVADRHKVSGGNSRAEKIVSHLNSDRQSKLTLNCTRCSQNDQAWSLRIENIKFNILNKLGMERAPNVSLKMLPRIPPISHILNQYAPMLGDDPGTTTTTTSASTTASTTAKQFDQSSEYFGPIVTDDGIEDEFYVNAEKSIVFAQTPPPDRLMGRELRAQYFQFPANIINSKVQRASLWLNLKASSTRKLSTNAWIVIYQVVKHETKGTPSLVFFKRKQLSGATIRKGGWVLFELKRLVAKWFQNPEQNLGISIHSYDDEGKPLTIIHNDDVPQDSELKPFMEVHVTTYAQESRKKRMAGLNCEDKSSEVRCCRYPLTVDFEQFGWDWIIAPKRYEANYCSGECPMVFPSDYPHTHLVQQTTLSNWVGPCCSPRKMSSISMLYMDANYNIIYGILPNMVVDRCGCS